MDFSRLSGNERLAFWGAVLSIIGAILAQVGFVGAGGLWLTFLLAIAMIVVVFLPQWSPQTALPGSKGTLMLIIGIIAGIGSLLGLLAFLSLIGFLAFAPLGIIGLLVGIVGGFLMAWAGWQEFQSEGGRFQLGGAAGPRTTDGPAGTGTTTTTGTTDTRMGGTTHTGVAGTAGTSAPPPNDAGMGGTAGTSGAMGTGATGTSDWGGTSEPGTGGGTTGTSGWGGTAEPEMPPEEERRDRPPGT